VLVNQLSKIIAHHTGLNITFELGNIDPCVEIPMVNKNNVLINSFIRNYLNSADGIKMVNDAHGVVRGKVDLKNGKVSGIFADVLSKIHLPVEMITSSKYESEEMAAITLHECGHLFTYYEFISRSVTTNQVLAGISKALDGSGTVEQREAVLLSAKKALNLSDLDAKELAKSNSKQVTELVVITNVTKQSHSELGCNIYDFSSWEYLSDQYAARNGGGRHIVTALDKLYRGMKHISFRSTPSYLAMEALKIALFVAVVTPVGALTIDIATVLVIMDSQGDGTYDVPGARFKRVRDQIVENLKDKDLSTDDIARLNADLDAIDLVLKEVNDRRQFFGVIWDAIAVWNYKGRDQKKLQQDLESIAINELFVKAAALKVAA
jgi:hypothetical protein